MHSRKTIRQLATFEDNNDSAVAQANDFMMSLFEEKAGRVKNVHLGIQDRKTIVIIDYDEWVEPRK